MAKYSLISRGNASFPKAFRAEALVIHKFNGIFNKLSPSLMSLRANNPRPDDSKYEFHNGRIYALAGGSLNHGLICGNIFGELRSGLKEKRDDCKAMTSEIKLYIQSENAFVYPDAMVVCGEINKSTKDRNSIYNKQQRISLSPHPR